MNNTLKLSHRKEKILAILSELETKGDMKNSGIESIKTTLIALGGAILGKNIGRPSLLLGIGTIAAGHYFDNKRLLNLGVGITAGGSIASVDSLKGPDDGLYGRFKNSMKELGNDMKHRLYVDKFIKPKGAATNGLGEVGEVQYFKYPNPELNMGSLDAIEQEIIRSSEAMEQRQMAGNNEEVSGSYDDVSGVEEKIY